MPTLKSQTLVRPRKRGNSRIAVYTALLWAYDLLGPMDTLADPATDAEGLALSRQRERARSHAREELDSDF